MIHLPIIISLVLQAFIATAGVVSHTKYFQNSNTKVENNVTMMEDFFECRNLGKSDQVIILSKNGTVHTSEDTKKYIDILSKEVDQINADVRSLIMTFNSFNASEDKRFRMFSFYDNGKIEETYEGIGNSVYGNYTQWDNEGQCTKKLHVISGDPFSEVKDSWKSSGKSYEYNSITKCKKEGMYKNGLPNGEFTTTAAHEIRLMSSVIEKESVISKENYEEGILMQGSYFENTPIESFVENGEGIATDISVSNNDFFYNCLCVSQYEIHNGYKDGEYLVYSINDSGKTIVKKGTYSKNKLNGTLEYFYPSGKTLYLETWSNGSPVEKQVFNEKGILLSEAKIIHTDKNSFIQMSKFFPETGNMRSYEEIDYKGLVINAKYFDEEGSIISEVEQYEKH